MRPDWIKTHHVDCLAISKICHIMPVFWVMENWSWWRMKQTGTDFLNWLLWISNEEMRHQRGPFILTSLMTVFSNQFVHKKGKNRWEMITKTELGESYDDEQFSIDLIFHDCREGTLFSVSMKGRTGYSL